MTTLANYPLADFVEAGRWADCFVIRTERHIWFCQDCGAEVAAPLDPSGCPKCGYSGDEEISE